MNIQMRRFIRSLLIWISTVCKCVSEFTWCGEIHEFTLIMTYFFGPRNEKTCLRGFGKNTGTDRPARPHSQVSAFVIRLLECTIAKLAIRKFSICSWGGWFSLFHLGPFAHWDVFCLFISAPVLFLGIKCWSMIVGFLFIFMFSTSP